MARKNGSVDFTANGTSYNAMHIAGDVYSVSPYGKRGSLLKRHRPARLLANGTFDLRGRWIN